MVPSIADRAPYFWKVISLFSNEDNWHESFSREQKLYAKEHTINFQKKQDPEKKNRNKKKKMHNTSMLHTHKTRQPKKPQTHNRLIVLFNSHGKQRGKKIWKGPNFMEAWSLKPGSQKLAQLLLANFRTQKPWKFSTAVKGRALKNYKTLIRR